MQPPKPIWGVIIPEIKYEEGRWKPIEICGNWNSQNAYFGHKADFMERLVQSNMLTGSIVKSRTRLSSQ